MLIRRESPADLELVADITSAAFARDDSALPVETRLLGELRPLDAWLPRLSLVASSDDGELVGHVVCTRGHIGSKPALGLGPLSVRPDHQRRGVGSALVHTALGGADALDEPVVVLLGDAGCYGRVGFRLAAQFGITPPVEGWAPYLQARPLAAWDPALSGPSPTRSRSRGCSAHRRFCRPFTFGLPVLGPPIATVIPVALKPKEGSLMKRIAILSALVAGAAVAAPAAMAGAPSPAVSAAAVRQFEGTVVSVDRSSRSFRLRDSERGTVRIRVTSRTRFERIAGFSGLKSGMTRIESTVRRSGNAWVATEVERSGGGGKHGDDD